MSLVFVGMGLTAFLSASILAIDVGMLMTARSQAQNSADAGALAGAVALMFDDFDDRTPSGPAVTNAINAALANQVMGSAVTVTPDDVEFLNDEAGEPTRVRVTVRRTVPTLIAQVLQILDSADISAVATAEVSPANAMTCVKPFTIPDKWIENQSPPWSGDDTYEAYYSSGPNKGQKRPDADVYIPAMDENGNKNPDYTGYNMQANRGQRLVIRAHHGNEITSSFYFSIAIAGVTGGAPYRWNIDNCNQHIMHWGEPLVQEPGGMTGPTEQGIQALIARDPNAYWDAHANRVAGSSYDGQSPRVFPIPLYDPEYYDSGKRNGRTADLKVANWIGFFAEEVTGQGIVGRIIPIGGIRDKTVENGATNLFPQAIRLVQ
jgi:hypothetical protein